MSFVTVNLATALGFPNKKTMLQFISSTNEDVASDLDTLKMKIDLEVMKMWKSGFKEIIRKHTLDMAEEIQEATNQITIANKVKSVARDVSLRTADSIIQSRSSEINTWNENTKRARTASIVASVESIPLLVNTPNLPVETPPTEVPVLDLPSSSFTLMDSSPASLQNIVNIPSSPSSTNTPVISTRTARCDLCIEKTKTILELTAKLVELGKEYHKLLIVQEGTKAHYYNSLKTIAKLNNHLGAIQRSVNRP